MVSQALSVPQRSLAGGAGLGCLELGVLGPSAPPVGFQQPSCFLSMPSHLLQRLLPEPPQGLWCQCGALLDALFPLPLAEWRKQFSFCWSVIFLPSNIWWAQFMSAGASSPTPCLCEFISFYSFAVTGVWEVTLCVQCASLPRSPQLGFWPVTVCFSGSNIQVDEEEPEALGGCKSILRQNS